MFADFPGGRSSRIASPTSRSASQLRAYAFERYKTKRKEDEEKAGEVKVTIAVAGVAGGGEGVRLRAARWPAAC